jgi:hypothetical protein
MLQNLSGEIRECLRCAEQCKQLAEAALTEPQRPITSTWSGAGCFWPTAMSLQNGSPGLAERVRSASRHGLAAELFCPK